MKDARKTKAQLIAELKQLRWQMAGGRETRQCPEGSDRSHQAVRARVQRRLRRAVQEMEGSDDFRRVLLVLRQALAELGLAFHDCGVNLIAPQAEFVAVSIGRLSRTGEWQQPMSEGARAVITRFWQAGAPVYRRDLESEDPYGERALIQAEAGVPVRSVVDVPFAYGTLAVNSQLPNAFTAENIGDLQVLTGVLEEGLRRRQDLRSLEQRNRELEQEVARYCQAAAALRRSEGLFRSLFENHGAAMLVIDAASGRIVDANPAAVRFYGWPAEQLCRMQIQEINTLSPAEVNQRMVEAQTARRQHFEFRHRRADGSIREVEVFSSRVDGQGRVLLYSIIHDITERKQLEQELIRTQRLRAVGELSAGVSHNLNNLLNGVLVPAEMLQMASEDPKVRRLAGTILEVGTRAADLVHRLHQSVRQTATATLAPLALNQAVAAVVQLMRPRWKDEPERQGVSIELHTALGEVPPIRGVEAELYDLLTNLLLNAVQALPQGGRIAIRTAVDGQMVRLDFSDTGVGMDEETRLRVFEPFFTTKMNVGTGLGLSTLYSSVTQWGGRVAVESAPGQGTAFRLHFAPWVAKEQKAGAVALGASPRPGRVLVVEDDLAVGTVLREALGARHQVALAADGQRALELCETGEYDVAIIDLGLPGATGDEVVRRLQARNPAVGSILFTGWELVTGDTRRDPFDFVLQKPLRSVLELEETVAQAMALCDRRRARG